MKRTRCTVCNNYESDQLVDGVCLKCQMIEYVAFISKVDKNPRNDVFVIMPFSDGIISGIDKILVKIKTDTLKNAINAFFQLLPEITTL